MHHLVAERTTLINQVGAVLLERGITVAQGRRKLETQPARSIAQPRHKEFRLAPRRMRGGAIPFALRAIKMTFPSAFWFVLPRTSLISSRSANQRATRWAHRTVAKLQRFAEFAKTFCLVSSSRGVMAVVGTALGASWLRQGNDSSRKPQSRLLTLN